MTGVRERAIETITRLIAACRESGSDSRATALECVAAIEGLGYRPTEARGVWPAHKDGSGLPSQAVRPDVEATRQRLAEINERKQQAAKDPS